jgi:hypothetical protein
VSNLPNILDNLSLLALASTVISAFRMLTFLNSRGKEKSAMYSFNPMFFLDYIEVTKKETGKMGIWFTICWVSFLLTALFGISSEVSNFLIKH